jgi:magnesium transporter
MIDERDLPLAEVATLATPRTVTWVDVDGVSHAPTMEGFGKRFQLHALTLADVVSNQQRPKIEIFPEYLYVVLRMPTGHRAEMEQVSIVLTRDAVLTFQEDERPGDCWEPVRQRIRAANGRLRALGPDYLAYSLIDAVIDGYFPVLEKLGDRIESIEETMLLGRAPALARDIHAIRADLVQVRRALWPLRDALGLLLREDCPQIGGETRVFFRDCYDHLVQLLDLVESYRDLGASLMELYLSMESQRLNEVMRVLTVISTIFIPLTFIAGVYGMNFQHDASPYNMPELSWRWGYPVVMAVMLLIGVLMLFWFRKKGWLGRGAPSPGEIDSSGGQGSS